MSLSMPYLAIAASVSPPPAMLNALELGDRARDRLGAVGERVELEHADRAVPDDRAGRLQLRGERAAVFGPMSRIRSSAATSVAAFDGRRRVGLELLGDDHVDRDRHLGAARLHRRDHRLRVVDQAGSARLLPIGKPAASMKVLAMPPPTISWSTFFGEALQDRQLGRDLAARDDRDQRPLRVRQRLRDRVDLGGEQRAGAGDLRELRRCRRSTPRRGARCRTRRARRCRTAPPSSSRAPRRSSSRPC